MRAKLWLKCVKGRKNQGFTRHAKSEICYHFRGLFLEAFGSFWTRLGLFGPPWAILGHSWVSLGGSLGGLGVSLCAVFGGPGAS